MGNHNKQVNVSLTEQQKRQLRIAAAQEGVSMSEFARQATLDALPAEALDAAETETDDSPDPLEDFIEAELRVDETAEPVAKARVYAWYADFCEAHYPGHGVETQHKVSREIAKLDGVDTGRRYGYSPSGSEKSSRTRCFLNLRKADQAD